MHPLHSSRNEHNKTEFFFPRKSLENRRLFPGANLILRPALALLMALGICKKIADARYFWCMAIVLVQKLPFSFDDCDPDLALAPDFFYDSPATLLSQWDMGAP